MTIWSLSAVSFLIKIIFGPNLSLFHHLVYGNTNQLRNIGEQKDIGVTKLSLPFGYGLGADSKEFAKFPLCKSILLTVIQDIFTNADSVFHFTRLYRS